MKRFVKWPAIMAVVLLVALLSVSIAWADKDSPMVGKWMLDGNGLDSSGYGNNGTVINNPTIINDGVHRQAYKFNSDASQYIEVPNSTYLNFGTGNFSISCWLRTKEYDVKQYMTLVDKGGPEGGGFQLLLYYGRVTFQLSAGEGSTNYNCTQNLGDDRWHNVVVSVNRSSNVNIYIDGVSALSSASRTGTVTCNGTFRIGASSIGQFFNGDIDEVMVYRQALSEDEIKEIYMNGVRYDEILWYYGKCQAKWNMDGNAVDSSGNINNGVLHGGPLLPEIVDGVHNWALFFNGTNYISVPDDPTLNMGMTPRGPHGALSISFWIKPSNEYPGGTAIIDKRSIVNGTYTGYLVQLYGQRPLLQLSDGTGWLNFYSPTGVQLNYNEWYFVAFTVDRRLEDITLFIYRRSTGVSNTYGFDCSAITGDLTNTAELYIGKTHDTGGSCFVGTLDDIKIYNKWLYTEFDEQFNVHR